jgi:putative ABC transport system ATP-binding protein
VTDRTSELTAVPPLPASDPAAVQASGLVQRYGEATALDGVDFAARSGESVAITGPSGSGKSTLLYALAGVVTPDEGSVLLDGRSLHTLPERHRADLRVRRIGMVFQFGGLLAELTAAENVALPLMLGGVPRREARDQALTWFEPLGLGGLDHRRPGQLSGGQAQRVAIARALVTSPSVVLADEPTGALDSTTGADVLDVLVGACRDHGAALVVVTHDRSVAAVCDHEYEMRDGRLRLLSGAGRR